MLAYLVPGRIVCTLSQCSWPIDGTWLLLASSNWAVSTFRFSPVGFLLTFSLVVGRGRSTPYLARSFSLTVASRFFLDMAVALRCRCNGHLIHSFWHLHRHCALGRLSLQILFLHLIFEKPVAVRSFMLPTFWLV